MIIVANWQDESEYSYLLDEMSPTLWAWEFLRRNSLYQEEYQNYVDNPEESFEYLDEDKTNWGEINYEIKPFMDYHPLFGISTMPHPLNNKPKYLRFNPFYGPLSLGKGEERLHNGLCFNIEDISPMWHPCEDNAAFLFDLGMEIGPQIEDAKNYLLTLQNFYKEHGLDIVVKRKKLDLHEHIRVLDARTAGASYGSIADFMYPEVSNEYPDFVAKQRAKDKYKAALDIVNMGYLRICLQRG